jgi:hypothetical protein
MIDHLQTALSPLAYRVVPTLPHSLSISRFDQICRVMARNLSSPQSLASQQGSLPERDDGQRIWTPEHRIHTLTEDIDEYDEDEELGETGINVNDEVKEATSSQSEKINSLRFRFESCVARMVWGIPVGAYYLNRKILSTVSSSLTPLKMILMDRLV